MNWPNGKLRGGIGALLLAGIFMILHAMFLPAGVVHAQQLDAPPNTLDQKTGPAGIWRDLRRGRPSRESRPFTPPVQAIQIEGEEWRKVRNEWIRPVGGGVLLFSLGGIILFALFVRRVPIAGGRSGRMVVRFSRYQRALHWFVASVFILLAVSGLILLFGRSILIPVMGKSAFAALASAAKQGHNLFGPVFIVGLLLLLPAFARHNRPYWQDIMWLVRGGFLSGKEIPSGKFNGGEKLWFWLLTVFGLIIAGSGVFLDFPFIAADLLQLQFSHILHAVAAIVLIAFAIGHAYLGSAGVEGVLEGMTTGCVDENWARQHHPLWLDELEAKGGKTARGCPHVAPSDGDSTSAAREDAGEAAS